MKRFEQINPEVYVARGPFLSIGREDIEELKSLAAKNPSRKARLCAHPSAKDPLHEMLIVHMRGAYVRPHKHIGKSESFHMIEGRLDIALFDDAGKVRQVLDLCANRGPGSLYYRLSDSWFHTVIPRSEVVVFHETTNGPFDRKDTVFAPWAPEEGDSIGIEAFSNRLFADIQGREMLCD